MANTRNANTFYIDTQYSAASDDLAVKGIKLVGIVASATSANASIILADAATGSPKKLEVDVSSSGDSLFLDLSNCPLVFPNGIRALTLTNARATCIIEENRG